MIRYLTHMFERFNPKKESIHQDFYNTLKEAYGKDGEVAAKYYQEKLASDPKIKVNHFRGLFVLEKELSKDTLFIVEVVRPKNLSGKNLYVDYLKSLKGRGYKNVQGNISTRYGDIPDNPTFKARKKAFGKNPTWYGKGDIFNSKIS